MKASYTIKEEFVINCWNTMYSLRDETGKEVHRGTNDLFMRKTLIPRLLEERYYKKMKELCTSYPHLLVKQLRISYLELWINKYERILAGMA